jgi:hypothetical protein
MTVGSLAVPALLSIQNGNTAPSYLYWVTWAISLAVTTSNGIMTLFKLDKQFFNLHATAERLRSETWQFIQLAGRYSGHHGTHKPTHVNQFVYYCSQLEKINMARVDDEYVNAGEDTRTPAPVKPSADGSAAKPSTDTMVPSPADQSNLDTPARDSISLVEDDDGQPQASKPQASGQKSAKTIPISIIQESDSPATASSKKSVGTKSRAPASATAATAAAAPTIEVSVSGSQEPAVPSPSIATVTVLQTSP